MKLSSHFINNIEATYGEIGKEWLINLPMLLKKLSKLWDFQFIRPVDELSCNFVTIVEFKSQKAILKISPKPLNLMQEAEWLRAHRKRAPKVLMMDVENNAFLMELLIPGNTLKSVVKAGEDEKATRIIANIIFDLMESKTSHQVNYPHISEHISALSFLRGFIDDEIVDKGESLFRELTAEHSKDIVLHGDLHHDNILQSGNSWKLIDPLGYVGNPCAEVGTMIYNPIDAFPENFSMEDIIEKRLKILAEMLPFDLQLIKDWCFCLTLRSAAWDVEGFAKPNLQTLQIAKVLRKQL